MDSVDTEWTQSTLDTKWTLSQHGGHWVDSVDTEWTRWTLSGLGGRWVDSVNTEWTRSTVDTDQWVILSRCVAWNLRWRRLDIDRRQRSSRRPQQHVTGWGLDTTSDSWREIDSQSYLHDDYFPLCSRIHKTTLPWYCSPHSHAGLYGGEGCYGCYSTWARNLWEFRKTVYVWIMKSERNATTKINIYLIIFLPTHSSCLKMYRLQNMLLQVTSWSQCLSVMLSL